ncbi:MAG: nuoN [Ignavibacteria bacterium]|nr:nuoN [Ignavibacteria bacterium]
MANETILMLPLYLIGFFSLAAVGLDPLFSKNKKVIYYLSLIGLLEAAISAGYALYLHTLTPAPNIEISYAKNMVSTGGMAYFFDILFCLSGILILLSSPRYFTREYKELSEFYSLILLSVSGMMIMAHSANLLVLFIGIEIMSLSFYILAGFIRIRIMSVEAALKYFLLGAFSTGFLVYGIAMIYGATGTLTLSVIQLSIQTNTINSLYLTIGIGLIIIGLSFKAAIFPFHQWAPDVYHGSPTVIAGFLSAAGKAAAMMAFIIIARAIFGGLSQNNFVKDLYVDVRLVLAVLSAATMLIGNITALVQKNIKRMLAYSSVAHAGYLLMGVVAANERGWSGILFYSTAYILMQIGAFIVISLSERNDEQNLKISEYRGFSKAHPYLAAIMSIFMFSLAGLPPFAGFFGKYYLFTAAVETGYVWLTIVAVISSLISMYFYIGLIIKMYFEDPDTQPMVAESGHAVLALTLSTAGVMIFGIFPSLLMDIAKIFF